MLWTEKLRTSAEKSYTAWAEINPVAAERYGLARYVAYVQGKQSEQGRSAYDLSQLARQMGRTEENRAASQFVPDENTKEAELTSTKRPRLSSPARFEALRRAALEGAKMIAEHLAKLRDSRPKLDPKAIALAKLRAGLKGRDLSELEAKAAKLKEMQAKAEQKLDPKAIALAKIRAGLKGRDLSEPAAKAAKLKEMQAKAEQKLEQERDKGQTKGRGR